MHYKPWDYAIATLTYVFYTLNNFGIKTMLLHLPCLYQIFAIYILITMSYKQSTKIKSWVVLDLKDLRYIIKDVIT